MLTYSNVKVPRSDLGYNVGPAVLSGGSIDYQFLWGATARTNEQGPGVPTGNTTNSSRTSKICYMKGLRERVDMALNSARPWMWRRIVFTMKGSDTINIPATGANFFVLTSSGYLRLVNDMTNSQRLTTQALVFEGQRNVDWTDIYNAKTDNTQVTILSDKLITLKPKTTAGDIVNRRFYYPFEKNLVYGDDEFGGGEGHNPWSVLSKSGMGDVFVYDMITPGTGSTVGDTLSMNFSSTLYWHEK